MLWSFLVTTGAIYVGNNASDEGLNALAFMMIIISGITLVVASAYLYYLKRDQKRKKKPRS